MLEIRFYVDGYAKSNVGILQSYGCAESLIRLFGRMCENMSRMARNAWKSKEDRSTHKTRPSTFHMIRDEPDPWPSGGGATVRA